MLDYLSIYQSLGRQQLPFGETPPLSFPLRVCPLPKKLQNCFSIMGSFIAEKDMEGTIVNLFDFAD